MAITDLSLRADTEAEMIAALPWARIEVEDGARWLTGGDGWALDVIGPVVTQPGEYDPETGEEIAPPVVDGRYHANLRLADPALADTVPAAVIVEDSAAARGWASSPPTPGAPPEQPPGPPSTDPNDHPLNKFQFEALVIAMGLSLAALESAIDAMPLPDFEKAVALSRLRNATTYNRNHGLVEAVRQQIDMPVEDLDAAWMQAATLR